MPKTYGALIEREPVVSTAAVETYTSPFDASQKVDKTTYEALMQDFNATQAQKSEVGAISTKDAISQINKQKGYLDTMYPPFGTSNEGLQKWANQDPEAFDNYADSQGYSRTPTTEGKAYFLNQMNQEAEYTEEQLKDPATRQFLTDNGFALVKSDGINVGSDFSTSQMQSGVNQASALVENLTKDFLNYNVDQDPDFQAQSASIKAEFDRLRRQMEKTNYQRAQAFRTLGMRSGATQYAEGLQMGVEGEELNQANQRLADIASEEAATISAARAAFKNNKFSEFNNKVTALRDLRDQKQKELENYNTVIANYTKKLQEEEKASIEKQKFEFEVYKFEEEMKMKKGEKEKPMVVSPGSSLYDPNTGEFLGTAPEPPDTDAPSLETWGGQVHQWNPQTETWETIGSENGTEFNQDNISAANLIAAGKAKLTDFEAKDRGAISTLLEKLPPKKEDVSKIQTKVDTLNSVLNEKGYDLEKAVGTNWLARIHFNPLSFNDKALKNNLIATIEQLVGEKALKALIDAKANGATFGALSEGELNLLKDSSTKFGNWARDVDGDGKTDYYEIDEKSFKKELSNIISEYSSLLQTTGVKQENPIETKIQEYYNQNPSLRGYIDELERAINPDTNEPYTPEEKAELLNISFNQPLSTGIKSSDVSKIKDGSKVVTIIGPGIATGIQAGSSKWKWGYDFVLAGGKGAPVPAPFNGTVVAAGKNGGFGNQVKIKLQDGSEIWLSHLDGLSVKPGQRIAKGMIIGKQGNTGALLSSSGQELTAAQRKAGRGTHIDITIKKPGGGYLTSKEVAALLGTRQV